MSMLSKGLKKIRKGLKLPPVTVKNVATKYGPAALAIGATAGVGLGPLAGVAGKAGALASKIPGATKAAGMFNTIRKSGIGKAARVLNGGKAITLKNTLEGAGKNVAKFGGGAFDAIKKNPLEYAGAAAAGINTARAMKRAGDYSKKAVGVSEQSYAERAPLRKLGVAGMSKPTAQPQGQDFTNAANPFARRRKVAAAGRVL